jgi:hypothetical protein
MLALFACIDRSRKHTKTSRLNFSSVRGCTKSIMRTGLGKGGMRDRMSRLAKISSPRIMKAQIRIVQGKPTSLTSFVTMMGKMTPPSEEPLAAMPKARARFLKNHVVTQLKAG